MQAMQIYLARNNVQAGPYLLEQVNTMLASGEVHLDDLAWHEGLDGWKKIGELTNGQNFYDPTGEWAKQSAIGSTEKSTTTIIETGNKNIDNKHDNPEKNKNRLTVDELYGRKPVEKNIEKESSESNKNPKEQKVIRIEIANEPHIAGNALASISSRIFAVLIDQLTLSMLFLPLWLNADTEKLNFKKVNSYDLMNQLISSTPQHIITMVMIFASALLFIQIFLLISKGQTIGKLVTGIRILDIKTHKVPSLTNILLLRTIVKQTAYAIPLIGALILLVDFIIMIASPKRQSLHDRIAKTYVAKAKDNQLKGTEAKKD